ncbi:MAG: hypothetical protein ACXVWF_01775 [Actinomycetota bacterium]
MKVVFHRPDDEEQTTVATVEHEDGAISVTSEDDAIRGALAHAYRRTPVTTEDASLRRLGTHGPVVLQPSDLEWFLAVTAVRAAPESGLVARFVAAGVAGGFDPAAGYRPFDEQVQRLDDRSRG